LSDNNKYIYTAVDTFTRFIVAVPIRNKEAVTVANVMIKEIFLRWGLPLEVLTDQGKEFEAELNLALLKALSVVKLRTGPYTPSTNGMIESWHKVMHGLLNKVISESQRDWSRWLPYIVFCYNCTVHSSVGFPPFLLQTGQNPRWCIDFLLSNIEESKQSVPEYTAGVLDTMHRTYALVRENLKARAEAACTWYDRTVKPRQFSAGQTVRVYCPRHFKGRSPKWQSFYKDVGIVEKRLNDVTYVVTSSAWKNKKIIHANKLKAVTTFN
jgi:hypothetical protein